MTVPRNGQVRFFLQYEPNSIPQFSSWGKDVSAESGYHQRTHVNWELGTVVVADGKRDDVSPDAVEGVFSSCRDLAWRRSGLKFSHPSLEVRDELVVEEGFRRAAINQ